ncbi:MAG: transcription antitermination factor NusB [Pseudomonadota bacterium]
MNPAKSAGGERERLLAARGLTAVLRHGRTLDQFEQSLGEPGLTPLTRELLYGSLRHYGALRARAASLLDKPLRRKDQDVLSLLAVGIYQLLALRIPDHAALSATVGAARKLKQPWAAGLINACLRRLQQEPGATLTTHEDDLPAALRRRLQDQYGDHSAELMAALARRAPMSIRINQRQLTLAQAEQALNAAELPSAPSCASAGRTLATPVAAATLPGFAEGHFAVQDAGAMLIADLIGALRPSFGGAPRRLLDACAAPGGKLFALLEHPSCAPAFAAQDSLALALERSAPRLESLTNEADRLGHARLPSLSVVEGDATRRDWWDSEPFDLIVIDAPCSGSGTLRRHPDLKWRNDFEALSEHTATQDAILANLAPLLAPDGLLLYVTCSLLREENDERVDALLAAQPQLRSVSLTLPTGQPTRCGWQLLPTDPQTDGFYYAAIEHLQ